MKRINIFLILILIYLIFTTYIIFEKKMDSSESRIQTGISTPMTDSSDNSIGQKLLSNYKNMQENLTPDNTARLTIENAPSTSGGQRIKKTIMQSKIHPERVTYQEGFYYEPITDKIKTRIYGLSYKTDCTVPYEDLRYVRVLYCNFEGESVSGEIICNKAIAQDLVEIFYELYQNDYPIEKIKLIDEYNADDDLSCAENNTSCFNYRVVGGTTKLSKHALGMAIDINPFYNPYVTYPNGVERISPPGSEPYADRDADLPYMIKKGDLCYNLFKEHGFTWGGEWKSLKDYQHFEKE